MRGEQVILPRKVLLYGFVSAMNQRVVKEEMGGNDRSIHLVF